MPGWLTGLSSQFLVLAQVAISGRETEPCTGVQIRGCQGLGVEGMENDCFMGTESPSGMRKIF